MKIKTFGVLSCLRSNKEKQKQDSKLRKNISSNERVQWGAMQKIFDPGKADEVHVP